jgi:hypothetical protein
MQASASTRVHPHAWAPALIVLALGVAGCRADAGGQQMRMSQHGTVSQTIGRTQVTIEYNRPVARGRKLFGPDAVVSYGRVWNPGADQATTVEFSTDVQVDGHQLAAGKYSLWVVPGPDEWTVVFSRAADVFHTPYPGREHDALRITVTPERGDHMETLAFYFPVVDGRKAILRLHWGETIVPISIQAP